MTKRFVLLTSILLMLVVLVSCKKNKKTEININLNKDEVFLKIGETYQLQFDTNDEEGLNFASSDDEVATVDKNGLVTAVSYGEVKITLTSKTNKDVKEELDIVVTESDFENIRVAEGMEIDLNFPEGATFDIGNSYIAHVNESGLLVAELTGKTTIKMFVNGVLEKIYELTVVTPARSVELSGPTSIYLDEVAFYEHSVRPLNGYEEVRYEAVDKNIAEITPEGEIIPLKAGTTTVKVISLQDDDLFDSLELTIHPTILVSNDTNDVKVGNWTFKSNDDLYNSLSDAIAEIDSETKILLHNFEQNDDVTLDKNIILEGINSTINSKVELQANNVKINNLILSNDAKIVGNSSLESFVFKNNKVEDINGDLLELDSYNKIEISNNEFNNINGTAIKLDNIKAKSETLIEKNNINEASNGIVLKTDSRLSINSYIHVYRNKINNIENGFVLDLANENMITNAEIYARFNEVTNYDIAINSVDKSMFEFTFNYWGEKELDLSKFTNVSEKYLLGHYVNKEDILHESKYRPKDPIIVDAEDVVDVINLGEKFQLNPIVLPYTSDRSNIIISVDNNQILELTRTWELEPVRSGIVNLTLSSFSSPDSKKVYEIEVTTNPGIHFKLDNQTNDLTIGTKFKIDATPFPYNLENEEVSFSSSNTNIATVDYNGNVEIKGAGTFIITASIDGEAVAYEELEFTSYEQLDDDNILDFITRRQVTYSNMHEITLYGTELFDVVHNESVTRVLLSDYPIHREHEWFLKDLNPNFRPGYAFSSDIPEEYKFNEDNAVWVVVHDTGNSAAGAGANLHARYLYNQANSPDGRQASWHYTVDAYESYMHLPENEVAWHAGDGSALPGLDKVSPALGGGNRNGIAIEMSVQKDGHVFKTWQNTAQLVGDLLFRYNLPLTHQRYHNDFSGKECPQTLRKAGLLEFFEELVENEYDMRRKHQENIKSIEFISHNEEIMNNDGTIIRTPNETTQVSYTVNIEMNDGNTYSRTFNTIVEGFWR